MKQLLSLLAAATAVSAHGYVDNATIGGEFYQFYQPYFDPYLGPSAPPRISRKLTSNGPVQDIASIDLQCGGSTSEGVIGSAPAPLHAAVAAGETVTLRWTTWPDSHMGPVLTYMARCPDQGCEGWEPGVELVWFKIHHDGRHTTDKSYPDDIWGSTPLMTIPNPGTTYTIPSCLLPGPYLVRHEIIALHSAWARGEAQFYPSCHQLLVSGSGSVTPSAANNDTLVSFPGAYSADDAGIFLNVWNPGNYTTPGPPVFTCPE
ncbi:family 61 putative glycoside hydrolase [Staphylotrichum tortipilum]|uniref:lytic cellulose monooxygenase (C4-dehydrogenating) n=1 Tax=Staphylotrichum tortipilum TaxID=2831512 RepID=A0AAN6MEH7_9PEZI|nr:family 61 putative glycoside hydrolase [Staphylotrichum longicolle]